MQTAKPVRPDGVPAGHVLVVIPGSGKRLWVTRDLRYRFLNNVDCEKIDVKCPDVYLDEAPGQRAVEPDHPPDTDEPAADPDV